MINILQMTQRAGQAIYNDLKKTNSKLNNCYISDLIRTQETFVNILTIMSSDCFHVTNIEPEPNELLPSRHTLHVKVLPRYHNLRYDKNGNYFANQHFWQVFSKDNKIDCKEGQIIDKCSHVIYPEHNTKMNKLNVSSNDINKYTNKCEMIKVNINWELYYKLYQKNKNNIPILEEIIFGNSQNRISSGSLKRISKRKINYNKICRYSRRY